MVLLFLIFLACGLMILLKIITSIAVDFLDFWAMNTDSAMNYFMMASEHGHFRGLWSVDLNKP